jgi:hypothetical protein
VSGGRSGNEEVKGFARVGGGGGGGVDILISLSSDTHYIYLKGQCHTIFRFFF